MLAIAHYMLRLAFARQQRVRDGRQHETEGPIKVIMQWAVHIHLFLPLHDTYIYMYVCIYPFQTHIHLYREIVENLICAKLFQTHFTLATGTSGEGWAAVALVPLWRDCG